MNKVLNEDQQYDLINFIGYGRLDADIWFLNFEETPTTASNLLTRLKFEQVEDIRNAIDMLGTTLQTFGSQNLHENWDGICEIMLNLEEKTPSTENRYEYFESRLGHSDGATLLAFLMPIPTQANTEWPYTEILTKYPSHEVYLKKVKPLRFDFFQELIKQYLPKVIIASNREAWPEYQKLFNDYKLAPNGDFMIGWDADTVVILTDDFSSPQMAGKIPALVSLIKENSLAIDTEKYTGPIRLSQAEIARQKKEAAKKAMQAKRKTATKHNPADPYCVCEFCLGYENEN